ncbi:hypothetical protein [Natrinema sp. 74]|uniref:hypothetical protein n=1 Tax=Natrinema sp. 74 TaxID=3384159 RepID=UPI0038D43563
MQIVADTEDGKPVVRIRCPSCRTEIDTPYALKHGTKIDCPECRETILFTVKTEIVPQ